MDDVGAEMRRRMIIDRMYGVEGDPGAYEAGE